MKRKRVISKAIGKRSQRSIDSCYSHRLIIFLESNRQMMIKLTRKYSYISTTGLPKCPMGHIPIRKSSSPFCNAFRDLMSKLMMLTKLRSWRIFWRFMLVELLAKATLSVPTYLSRFLMIGLGIGTILR
jgi:hypothetical protein